MVLPRPVTKDSLFLVQLTGSLLLSYVVIKIYQHILNALENFAIFALVEERNFRPQELDEAAKRRFAKRLYIALPCLEARMLIVRSLLKAQSNSLSEDDIKKIGDITEGSCDFMW